MPGWRHHCRESPRLKRCIRRSRRLSTRILAAFRAQDWGQVRYHAHQLLGMAGLYEMPLLEDSAAQLHQAAQEQDPRALWRACSRLERLAKKESLE